jgi:hypothetical protein
VIRVNSATSPTDPQEKTNNKINGSDGIGVTSAENQLGATNSQDLKKIQEKINWCKQPINKL